MNLPVAKPPASSPTAATAGKAPPAKPAAAAKPAPPPKPSKPTKKRSHWRLYLFLLLVLAFALFILALKYPDKVEQFTGWQMPIRLNTGGDKTEALTQEIERLKQQQQQLTAQLQALQTWRTQQPPADQLTRQLKDNEQRYAQLAVAVAAVKESAALPRGEGNGDNTDIRLRLINLELRLSGDSAAAAAALQQLVTDSVDRVDNTRREWFEREITRLQAMPTRGALLAVLRRNAGATPTASATATPANSTDEAAAENDNSGGWREKLESLLNIRRTHQTTTAPHATTAKDPASALLARLELLLLSGQDEAYWRLLQNATDNATAITNATMATDKLRRFGAPDYRLRLP